MIQFTSVVSLRLLVVTETKLLFFPIPLFNSTIYYCNSNSILREMMKYYARKFVNLEVVFKTTRLICSPNSKSHHLTKIQVLNVFIQSLVFSTDTSATHNNTSTKLHVILSVIIVAEPERLKETIFR